MVKRLRVRILKRVLALACEKMTLSDSGILWHFDGLLDPSMYVVFLKQQPRVLFVCNEGSEPFGTVWYPYTTLGCLHWDPWLMLDEDPRVRTKMH